MVSKEDSSPLTIADKKSNDIICSSLASLTPEIPIVSEENKQVSYSERKNYEVFWQVDPLDGTKEFIKRNGEFTVNIALIKDGRSIMGVVFCPYTNDMYYAYSGGGAWLENSEGLSKILSHEFSLKDSGLRMVCSRSHLNDATKAFVEKFDSPELVAKGSSLKFMILAVGKADIYPRLGPTMEWDTSSAQIILEEAGGSVIDQSTGEPLRYNKENLLNPYFIAYGSVNSQMSGT